MSKELLQFLREWLDWAESGGPSHPFFVGSWGLCSNLTSWTLDGGRPLAVRDEFSQAINNAILPFNGPSMPAYHIEAQHQTCHLNPMRLAWVREQLAKTTDPIA